MSAKLRPSLPPTAKPAKPIKSIRPYGRSTSRSGNYSFAAYCPFCLAAGRRSTILATRDKPDHSCPTCGERLHVQAIVSSSSKLTR